MYSGRVVACLLLAGLVFVCGDEVVTPSLVPMFLWSNTAYFTGNHNSYGEAIQSHEVHSLLLQLVSHKETKTKLNSYVNKALSPPEILLAFVYPQLSSSEASRLVGGYSPSPSSNSFLKNAITSSSSSLSVPYVLSHDTVSESLVNAISSFPHSQLIAAELESGQKTGLTGCDALLNHLEEDPEVFSDGITDLILIHYDHTKDNVKCMDRVINHVNTHTKGKFITLVSADKDSAKPIQMVFADGTESAKFERIPISFTQFAIDSHPGRYQTLAAASYAPVVYVGVQYVTPETLVGLFLGFFMVFVIYIGASCVMYIETPVRFSSTPMQVAKEY